MGRQNVCMYSQMNSALNAGIINEDWSTLETVQT